MTPNHQHDAPDPTLGDTEANEVKPVSPEAVERAREIIDQVIDDPNDGKNVSTSGSS